MSGWRWGDGANVVSVGSYSTDEAPIQKRPRQQENCGIGSIVIKASAGCLPTASRDVMFTPGAGRLSPMTIISGRWRSMKALMLDCRPADREIRQPCDSQRLTLTSLP